MPDFTLTAISPLDGFSKSYDDIDVTEKTGVALVSIAVPHGGEEALSKALAKALAKAYKIEVPRVGQSSHNKAGNVHLLGMQADQFFLLFDFESGESLQPVDDVANRLGAAGYYTDQTDSWVMVSLAGQKSREALARICALDLHEKTFQQGAVARTVMEHLGTIIFRDGPDCFVVLSPRSSAKSLLHAITTSINNVL